MLSSEGTALLRTNIDISDWELSSEDMERIDSIGVI